MRVTVRIETLVAAVLVLAGCGNSLSRSSAEAALSAYSAANVPTATIALDDVVDWKDGFYAFEGKEPMDTSAQRVCWEKLVSQGALSEPKLKEELTEQRRDGWRNLYYSVEVIDPANVLEIIETQIGGTDKRLLARVARVVTARRSITSVDGVTEPAQAAMGQVVSSVNFTYTEEGTGFNSAYCSASPNDQMSSHTYKPSPGPQHGSAIFVLYDDGWKVEDVDW